MSKNKMKSLAIGGIIGATMGVLFAPKKGSDTRKDLKKKGKECLDNIKDFDLEEGKENLEDLLKKLEKEIKDLDKEKILETAREKGDELVKKADKLVDSAMKNGNEMLEDAANELRKKAIDTTKKVLEKLEKK